MAGSSKTKEDSRTVKGKVVEETAGSQEKAVRNVDKAVKIGGARLAILIENNNDRESHIDSREENYSNLGGGSNKEIG